MSLVLPCVAMVSMNSSPAEVSYDSSCTWCAGVLYLLRGFF